MVGLQILPLVLHKSCFYMINLLRDDIYELQVIVVGEVNTGKSAIIRRYVHNFFSDRGDYRATLGVDFNLKLIHYNDELEIRLQLWDIAGQVGLFFDGVCNTVMIQTRTVFSSWTSIDGSRSVPVII